MRGFAALGLLSMLISACTSGDGGPAASTLARSSVSRLAPDATAGENAGNAIAAFGADLYAILTRADGNLVFSPYSAAAALAMARAGARGDTAAQLDLVLHADLVGDLDAGINVLDQALAAGPGDYEIGDQTVQLELATANQLWGQTGFEFEQDFLDRLAASYGAGMRLVDYREARDTAREAINEWVAEQTRDRIPDLMPEGVLTELTRLVLVNAIYLKAQWLRPFDEGGTTPAPFHRLDGTTSKAELMRLSERLRYTAGSGYQAIELPYVDGSLAMTVIVLDEGAYTTFEGGLNGERLTDIIDSMQAAEVNLRFPRFEFRTKAFLSGALAELGMPLAFTEAADFSGMTGVERLLIQEVVQEAFISVEEEGTGRPCPTCHSMTDRLDRVLPSHGWGVIQLQFPGFRRHLGSGKRKL